MDYKALAQELITEYGNSMLPVENIGKTLERYFTEQGKKFSAKVFCVQFDCLLQYSMLELSVADGEVAAVEVAAIKGLTKYGDLVEYINSNYKTKISWDDILNASNSVVKKWLANQKPLMDKLAEEFIYGFAMVDASVTKEDILKKLISGWAGILSLLAWADGQKTQAEQDALKDCIAMEVVVKIEQLVKQAENK